jgi:hypothetical protein
VCRRWEADLQRIKTDRRIMIDRGIQTDRRIMTDKRTQTDRMITKDREDHDTANRIITSRRGS